MLPQSKSSIPSLGLRAVRKYGYVCMHLFCLQERCGGDSEAQGTSGHVTQATQPWGPGACKVSGSPVEAGVQVEIAESCVTPLAQPRGGLRGVGVPPEAGVHVIAARVWTCLHHWYATRTCVRPMRSGGLRLEAYALEQKPMEKVALGLGPILGVVVCAGALTPYGGLRNWLGLPCAVSWYAKPPLPPLRLGPLKGVCIRWGSRDRTPPAIKRQTGGTQSVSQP